jgi:hypothetical protein
VFQFLHSRKSKPSSQDDQDPHVPQVKAIGCTVQVRIEPSAVGVARAPIPVETNGVGVRPAGGRCECASELIRAPHVADVADGCPRPIGERDARAVADCSAGSSVEARS